MLVYAILTAGLSVQQVYAQTFAEWFKQKSTQKKYLLQQISALMVYRQYAQQGYAIAKGGLSSIGNYISGEFDLHGDHYKHLRQVNAAVRGNPQANSMLRWQGDILNRTAAIQKMSGFKPSEQDYLHKVCTALLQDCDGLLYELELLLTDGKAEMSDEQRLRQLGRLHEQMKDNVGFANRFYNACAVYAQLKKQATSESKRIQQLYESDQ